MGNKDSIDATTPKWFRARVSLAIISTSIRSITITSSRFRFYVTTETFSRLLPLKWRFFSGFDGPLSFQHIPSLGILLLFPSHKNTNPKVFPLGPASSIHPSLEMPVNVMSLMQQEVPRRWGGAVVEVIFYGRNHGQIHRKILGNDGKII